MVAKAPEGLRAGGIALWRAYSAASLTEPQRAVLIEACRARDRLDQLDRVLSGEVDVWARIVHRAQTQDYELKIDDALTKANSTASNLRQLLTMLPVAATAPKARNALDELAKRRAGRGPTSAAAVGTAGGDKRR